MGDGWETKRSFAKDHQDWVIIKLYVSYVFHSVRISSTLKRGVPGYLATAVIDTIHFKGNFPESCDIQGIYSQGTEPDASDHWKMILPPVKLGPNRMHFFQLNNPCEQYTHVKVSIYPDGGIKRIRIIGTLATETTAQEDRKNIIVEEGWEILEGIQG